MSLGDALSSPMMMWCGSPGIHNFYLHFFFTSVWSHTSSERFIISEKRRKRDNFPVLSAAMASLKRPEHCRKPATTTSTWLTCMCCWRSTNKNLVAIQYLTLRHIRKNDVKIFCTCKIVPRFRLFRWEEWKKSEKSTNIALAKREKEFNGALLPQHRCARRYWRKCLRNIQEQESYTKHSCRNSSTIVAKELAFHMGFWRSWVRRRKNAAVVSVNRFSWNGFSVIAIIKPLNWIAHFLDLVAQNFYFLKILFKSW